MWKIAVLFAICLAPVAMPRQKQTPARERQREAQQPPPAITVTTNENSAYDKQRSADKPQGWHKFVTWPEGIVTWAIILTLGAIVCRPSKPQSCQCCQQKRRSHPAIH